MIPTRPRTEQILPTEVPYDFLERMHNSKALPVPSEPSEPLLIQSPMTSMPSLESISSLDSMASLESMPSISPMSSFSPITSMPSLESMPLLESVPSLESISLLESMASLESIRSMSPMTSFSPITSMQSIPPMQSMSPMASMQLMSPMLSMPQMPPMPLMPPMLQMPPRMPSMLPMQQIPRMPPMTLVPIKRKLLRINFTDEQTKILEQTFQNCKFNDEIKTAALSTELNLTEEQVKIWFRTRRAKGKKRTLENPKQFLAAKRPIAPAPPQYPRCCQPGFNCLPAGYPDPNLYMNMAPMQQQFPPPPPDFNNFGWGFPMNNFQQPMFDQRNAIESRNNFSDASFFYQGQWVPMTRAPEGSSEGCNMFKPYKS